MKTVIAQYQNSPIGRDQSTSLPITADTILAAARRHEKYLRAVPPRDYQMRVFEDGSVFFRNTTQPTLRRLIPLAELQNEARWFYLNPARSLWRHVLAIWE